MKQENTENKSKKMSVKQAKETASLMATMPNVDEVVIQKVKSILILSITSLRVRHSKRWKRKDLN